MIRPKILRVGDKSAHIYLSSRWAAPSGATSEAQLKRQRNRSKLQMALDKHLSANEQKSKSRAIIRAKHSSISHTEKMGGFAVSFFHVGLDIEQSNRAVSAVVQRRLGSIEELKLFSTPIELWAAKEAAWKAFYKHPQHSQPDVISDIKVIGKTSPKTFEFQIPGVKKIVFSGRIFKHKKHTIALVLV